MTTYINGTTGVTFPDASVQASSQVGMKNKIIDGGFIINQRGYVSGTALSAGSYGHDRWKAGAGGGTYTFTQGALGVNTTITITAGTVVQVIEGCNLPEGGTYVLSWTGTAQGRLNGGAYGSSGTVTVTGWVAGTNLNVEFSTGTLGSVQLEKGSTASSYDHRPYGTELQLAQRYYTALGMATGYTKFPTTSGGIGNLSMGVLSTFTVSSTVFPVQMRTSPTIVFAGADGTLGVIRNAGTGATYSVTSYETTDKQLLNITATGITAGMYLQNQFSATAEL